MRSQPDPDGPSSFAPLGRKQHHPKPTPHNSRRRQPRSAAAATSSSAASSAVYILRALLFVLAISTATATVTSSIPFGYQSTQSSSLLTGSTYAASAAYDPVSGILYVTGATYEDSLYADVPSQGIEGDGTSAAGQRGSDCYLTALALPSNPTGASGIITKSLGEAGISEACTAIALLSSTFRGTSTPEDGEPTTITTAAGEGEEEEEEGNVESSHLLVLGHTGPNGLLTDLRNYGTDQSTTYGYGLDLTISAKLPDGGIKIDDETGQVSQQTSIEFTTDLLGGKLFHEEEISYPIAVAVPTALSREVEEGDEMMGDGYGASRAGPEFVYVLLQTSDVDPTAGWGRNGDSDNNNFGFGAPADEEENNNNGVDNEEENGGDEEEEEDPTVPSSGGTSLTIKKLALTSTGAGGSSSFSSEQEEAISQSNSMVGQTMIDQWTQQYAPLDGTAVSAADLLYVPRTIATSTTDDNGNDSNSKRIKSDVLLMAGSTRGFGPTFGQSNADGTYDTDGFVTLLDPATGLMIDPTSFSGSKAPSGRDSSTSSSSSPLFSSSGKGKTSLRIKSTFDGHDVIYGLCIDESETDNVDSVYIVGSTTGTLTRPSSKATTGVDGSLQINTPSRDKVLGTTPRRRAFVMKLNLRDGLQPEWVREYESEVGRRGSGSGTDAYATGCAVSSSDDDDGSVHVYVGGVVTDGGRIAGDGVGRHRHFSSGGDDIFLVRMDGQSGKADWARQIGSRGHDRLASRGGVVLDSDGGAILVGTTGGSLMRSRDDDADPRSMDAFVMSVSKFGEAVTPVDPAIRSTSGECYFVSDPTLYLVIVSVVSALCAFLLGHALRQRQALAKIIKRYSTNGREVKGTVVKKNKTRWCDVASRHILVRYRIPSSSGGRLIKRIDNLSKDTHRYLMLGSLINIHIIPGHDKSGVALQELRVSLKRLWRDIVVIGFLLLASFGMSLVFATCLPWYGWVIATVPSVVTASLAWLLWRNAYPNMELVFIHGEGCIPSGRIELSAIEGLDDFTENDATDNDQTDDDTSSPNNNDVVWLG